MGRPRASGGLISRDDKHALSNANAKVRTGPQAGAAPKSRVTHPQARRPAEVDEGRTPVGCAAFVVALERPRA